MNAGQMARIYKKYIPLIRNKMLFIVLIMTSNKQRDTLISWFIFDNSSGSREDETFGGYMNFSTKMSYLGENNLYIETIECF